MRKFDLDDIMIMAAFENITGTGVRDCLIKEVIYFLVDKGKAGLAIGKSGQKIKAAEDMLGRPIKIFEWADSSIELIKSMIPSAKQITLNKGTATVMVESKFRGTVIGKEGSNVKVIKEFLDRNTDIKELKIL